MAGLLAGALFALLIRELGIWSVMGLHHRSILAVLPLALLGAVLARWRRARIALWALDVTMLGFLLIVALTPVMSPLMRRLVRVDPIPAEGVDAVVVLSADVTSAGTISDIASDRLLAGLDLMRRGVAPRLLTTRVAYHRYGKLLSTDADQDRLITLAGVSDRWTVLADEVGNTHDEALATQRHLSQSGGNSVAVVTSPWHSRRSCATFEATGLRVVCAPALERGDQTVVPLSERDRIAAFRYFVYERAAWVEYWWRGWVPK